MTAHGPILDPVRHATGSSERLGGGAPIICVIFLGRGDKNMRSMILVVFHAPKCSLAIFLPNSTIRPRGVASG